MNSVLSAAICPTAVSFLEGKLTLLNSYIPSILNPGPKLKLLDLSRKKVLFSGKKRLNLVRLICALSAST